MPKPATFWGGTAPSDLRPEMPWPSRGLGLCAHLGTAGAVAVLVPVSLHQPAHPGQCSSSPPGSTEIVMFNWFDMMQQAHYGAGFDNMARQFGLTPDQTQRAIAAVLPAFMMAFQRQAMNPNAMTQLFQTMAGGHYPNFFESATQAFSPQGRQEGKVILDQLFGSDEVSHRVAQQAAQFSGVGTEALNQILPLAAAILAGGITKAMTAQGAMMGPVADAWRSGGMAPPTAGQTGVDAWTDMWRGWMNMAIPTQPQAPRGPAPNPFEEMMASFMRASQPPRAR